MITYRENYCYRIVKIFKIKIIIPMIRLIVILVILLIASLLIFNKKFREAFTLSTIPLIILVLGLIGYMAYYMVSTNYFN